MKSQLLTASQDLILKLLLDNVIQFHELWTLSQTEFVECCEFPRFELH